MKKTYDFNFDYWMNLNKENPDDFEIERRKLIEKHIENSHFSKRRLEGIQFRIDLERGRSQSPMGSCIKLSRLMMDFFHEEFISAVNNNLFSGK